MLDILIIGGGITGLSAAWEIQQRSPNTTYGLLEAARQWGGKVSTQVIEADGQRFIIDGGPDTLITRKPEAWQLTAELGIQNQTISPASETKDIYVLDGGVVHPIPLSPALFLRTPLLTWRGKLRLLSEPFQPARRDDGDESLADFVTRRLGREALEKFIGPVLGGIYNTDPARQSILVASPVMREMEKEAGSLVLAALERMRKRRRGPKIPRFFNFEEGMSQLPQALAAQLKGSLRLNAPVTHIERTRTGFAVALAGGETLQARAIIVATLANTAARLLQTTAPQTAALLRQIRHENIGTASLVYRASDLPARPSVNGLMIPRREQRAIDAVTVTSRKIPQRAAPGYALVRVFFGGAKPEMVTYDDPTLLAHITSELRVLLGIRATPLAHAIFRWEAGFPQADVGHLQRIAEIETSLPPGITLAGSSYRGIAVPDCIRQGRLAAQHALSALPASPAA